MDLNFKDMPGYVLDLLYLFSLNFNDEEKLKFADDVWEEDRICEIKKYFGNISDDLQIFFAMKKNGRCFMTTCYFSKYSKYLNSEYNLDFLLRELENYEEFEKRLITFYFPETEMNVLDYYTKIEKLAPHIDNSEYSEVIKRKLYSFFINPSLSIQNLINELKNKEKLLAKYYNENMFQIIEIKVRLVENEEDVVDICSHLNIDGFDDDLTVISLCLINQNCMWAYGDKFLELLIVGCNYENVLSYYKRTPLISNLCSFGDIFSEKNRIDILKYMKAHGEITIKDLEKQLSFTGSTAYYHLTMMLKENMIIARNQGRTVLYRINPLYFKSIILQLEEFI